MLVVRRDGRPVAALVTAANHAENTLAEATLAAPAGAKLPAVLLADAAYDDDKLRDRLAAEGLFLLAPHRANRVREARHDGRHLRRYRRRFVVERAFAWLESFRRVATRHELYPHLYQGFVALACLVITARMLAWWL